MAVRSLFVRIPEAQADELDRTCERLGMTKQAVVRNLLDGGLRLPETRDAADDVLSFEALVELLAVDAALVRVRVEAGDIPGRRFGDAWRFRRGAVLDWLAGSDARPRAVAGFGPELGT